MSCHREREKEFFLDFTSRRWRLNESARGDGRGQKDSDFPLNPFRFAIRSASKLQFAYIPTKSLLILCRNRGSNVEMINVIIILPLHSM